MNWLLWREYRLNRWILVFGTIGILLPYLVAVAVVSVSDPDAHGKYITAYGISYGAAWVTIALLAGGAVAGSRADRSAEFQILLPLPSGRVLVSKMVLPALIFVVAACVTVVFVNLRIRPIEPPKLADAVDLPIFASVLLVTFCGGWLFTQLVSSTAYAAILGALCPIAVVTHVGIIRSLNGAEGVRGISDWVAAMNVVVAVLCFGIGTWVFLRRTEP